MLGTDDIFLIDIGPVFEKWEGDGGDTFVTGSDPDDGKVRRRCAHAVPPGPQEVEGRRRTGKQLYDFADGRSEEMGWELNLDLSGHRISDFPHAAVYDGPMTTVDFTPSPLLWVLEIHIRHPTRQIRRVLRRHAARRQLLRLKVGVSGRPIPSRRSPRRGGMACAEERFSGA